MDYERKILRTHLLPTKSSFANDFFTNTNPDDEMALPSASATKVKIVKNAFNENKRIQRFCKPIWEPKHHFDDDWWWKRLGFQRQTPGPWEIRIPLNESEEGAKKTGKELLLVATDFISDHG